MNREYLLVLVRQGRAICVEGVWHIEVWQTRQAGKVVAAVLSCGGDVLKVERYAVDTVHTVRYRYRTAYMISATLPSGTLPR